MDEQKHRVGGIKGAVGNNIRSTRERAGMTMQEMAEELDVSTATVSDWENGKVLPRADKLDLITKHFFLNYEDLVLEKPDTERASKPRDTDIIDLEALLNSHTRLVFRDYVLTKEEKRLITRNIEAILEFGRNPIDKTTES